MLNRWSAIVSLLLISSTSSWAVSVLQHHNDIGGTGVNSQETALTPATVRSSFGKLYSLPVQGQVYAQPLYLAGVSIPGYGARNVLYVATQANWVYAFDADSSTPLIYWQTYLGAPVQCTQIPGCYQDIVPQIGVTSTPVIDLSRNAIDIVASTYSLGNAVYSLYSLNLTTGAQRPKSPVAIAAQVPGTSSDGNGTVITFKAIEQLQRPALLLLNGNVYFAFGSHQDLPPFHGWIFGYDGSSLRQLVVKCISPNQAWSGIWQGGAGLTADSAGNIYAVTGNGVLTAQSGGQDYGDSVVKMNAISGLTISGYFSPSNQDHLYNADVDLGAGGVIVLPVSVVQTTPFIVTGGKDGRIFLLDSGNLSGFNADGDTVLQEFQATNWNFGGEVYFNSALYTWGAGDYLSMWPFSGTSFASTPVQNVVVHPVFDYKNAPAMSISSNGLTNGILWATWAVAGGDNGGAYPGTLYAFDASDLTELWNSGATGGPNDPGSWAKWCPPTVANGKVYVATFDGAITVFGLSK